MPWKSPFGRFNLCLSMQSFAGKFRYESILNRYLSLIKQEKKRKDSTLVNFYPQIIEELQKIRRRDLKKFYTFFIVLHLISLHSSLIWAMEDTKEDLNFSSQPTLSSTFHPRFNTVHQVVDDIFFTSKGMEEGLFKSITKPEKEVVIEEMTKTLSLEQFFMKLDNCASQEEKKQLYETICPISFARMFFVSYVAEPLCSYLPSMEIRYNSEGIGFLTFKEYDSPLQYRIFKGTFSNPLNSSEEIKKPLYGFRNPLYLFEALMESKIPSILGKYLPKSLYVPDGYSLQFMSENPTEEALSQIKPKEIGIFSKGDDLYFKSYNEKEINKM